MNGREHKRNNGGKNWSCLFLKQKLLDLKLSPRAIGIGHLFYQPYNIDPDLSSLLVSV
jgi:hypothetical protein